MGHPDIDNETPFAFAPLLLADEEGRPVVTTIVKATFAITPPGRVALADEQAPVDFAGKYHGEPGKSSYRFEPETAFTKAATDVVLLGHAFAPRAGTTQMEVGFRVGPQQKIVRVSGDRHWEAGLFGVRASKPAAFATIPLTYERAFGGWDRTADRPDLHEFEARNPVGVGFLGRRGRAAAGAPLPNLEDPSQPMTAPGARPAPAGFGFVGPDWLPRAVLAGTFDPAWSTARAPLLPKDFDRRFFNAASPGLVAPGYLRGDEAVVVLGATPEGRCEFTLPALAPPRCRIAVRSADDRTLDTNLDTVIVDMDRRRVILLWRAFTTLRSGPHDLRAIKITCANAPAGPRPTAPVPASPLPAS